MDYYEANAQKNRQAIEFIERFVIHETRGTSAECAI